MVLEKDLIVIERLYDALFHEDGWAGVIADIAASFQSASAGFFEHNYQDETDIRYHMHGLSDQACIDYAAHYAATNPVFTTVNFIQPNKIASDLRLMQHTGDRNALKHSEFYQDWMRVLGLDHAMGLTLEENEGRVLNFTLMRHGSFGHFTEEEESRFRLMTKHLGTAFRLQRKMHALSLRAQVNEKAIDALNVGIFQVSENAHVNYMNPYAERLVRQNQGLLMRAGVVSLRTPLGECDGLTKALSEVKKDKVTAVIRSDKPYGGHLTITISPLSEERGFLDVLRSGFLVFVTVSDDTPVKQMVLLRSLWGLTESEARLTLKLMSGETLKEAAQQIGVTYETARFYCKQVFRKCGVSRQSELLTLILRQMI